MNHNRFKLNFIIILILFVINGKCGVIFKREIAEIVDETTAVVATTTLDPLVTDIAVPETLLKNRDEEFVKNNQQDVVDVNVVADNNDVNDEIISTTEKSAALLINDEADGDFGVTTTETTTEEELLENVSKNRDSSIITETEINQEANRRLDDSSTENISTQIQQDDPSPDTLPKNSTSKAQLQNNTSTENQIVDKPTTEKKGKYLNQFNNGGIGGRNQNQNTFNGIQIPPNSGAELWALANMLKHESNRTNVQSNGNLNTNNTLKLLTDWSEIMKNVDFTPEESQNIDQETVAAAAETVATTVSFARLPTTTTLSPPPSSEDEENKIEFGTTKKYDLILTTENRAKYAVGSTTEESLDDFEFIRRNSTNINSKSDNLENIDDSATTSTTTQKPQVTIPTRRRRPQLTNFIRETTTTIPVTTESTYSTTGYEVSESIDEEYDLNESNNNKATTEVNELSTNLVEDASNSNTEIVTEATTDVKVTDLPVLTTTKRRRTTTSTTTEIIPTTTEEEIDDEIFDPKVNELTHRDSSTENIPANTTVEPSSLETTKSVEINEITAQQSTIIPHYITTTVRAFTSTNIESNIETKPTESIDATSTTTSTVTTGQTPAISIPQPKILPTQQATEKEIYVTEDEVISKITTTPSVSSTDTLNSQDFNDGGAEASVIIAVTVSLACVVTIILVIAALYVMKKRQTRQTYGQRCRPVGLDAYSLDNVSVYNSVRRKGNTLRLSKRSYGNSAFEDPGLKPNSLSPVQLSNFMENKNDIYEEFKEIPQVTVRSDEVPDGCEDKNRYANVVPLPETRVHLKRLNDDEKTEYINANFVKGPKDSTNYYIACQAPMENTITDFWRMIWEQNSKVIIMATDLCENGVEKCADYLPPSVVLDNNRQFGDFQVTLKNREMKDKYSLSMVHLKNLQTNTWREIIHFWYQWPDTGVPSDETSIISLLLEVRGFLKLSSTERDCENNDSVITTTSNNNNNNNVNSANNNNNNNLDKSVVATNGTMTLDKTKSLQRTQGPLTVHCSPGTGRTGTIIACDIAMRILEIPPRNIDIPQLVFYVRRGRANSVRTKEQYEFIYKLSSAYATKLTTPSIEN
uniref:Protein tyrosine phosphatase n=1 Tax=Corethrella appendiculata TaxID=1370023 RepID=U5EQN7_9DIPT